MRTYQFEDPGKEPLYLQLYRFIREDILDGTLQDGERLPSKRMLSKNLNISVITVENAYAQLQMEGYIFTKPRSGFYVSMLGQTARLRRRAQEKVEHPERELPAQKKQSAQKDLPGENKAGKSPAGEPEEGGYFADLSSNRTLTEHFPFATWAKITRDVLALRKDELLTNPPGEGTWELRSAIAAHLEAFRGIKTDAAHIVAGAGTEYLYSLLILLLGADLTYAVENPGYRKVGQILRAWGVKCIQIPVDEEGLRTDVLGGSAADVVHVTPSHHFPTGITMTAGRRSQLLDWAEGKTRRYILEDDYDSEFRLSGRPVPTLFEMDRSEQVIYLNTFTKSLASTIRISYMVLPEPLMKRYRERLSFYSCTVPTFEQLTLSTFMNRGYFEKHINRVRNASRRTRDCLLEGIRGMFPGDLVTVSEENAGLHFLLKIRLKGSRAEFVQRLKRQGIRLGSLEEWYEGGTIPEDAGRTFVVNYSSLPQDRIEETLRRIQLCITQDQMSAS